MAKSDPFSKIEYQNIVELAKIFELIAADERF